MLEREITQLLKKSLAAKALKVTPIAAGLGHRRFYRVETNGEPPTVIVRVENDTHRPLSNNNLSKEPPLEPLRSVFEKHGIPVPLSFGNNTALGIDILEDLGDNSLKLLHAKLTHAQRKILYPRLLNLVPKIQSISRKVRLLPTFKRKLSRHDIQYKGELFLKYSLNGKHKSVVQDAFECIAEVVENSPAYLAHRDFQSENILLRTDDAGNLDPVLIDFQGAFFAPPEYDLVCLLRDSYTIWDDDEMNAQLRNVCSEFSSRELETPQLNRFHLLTVSRKAKDHARFLQAARVNDDSRYVPYIRGTWQMICSASALCSDTDPRVSRLADCLADIPESATCVP